MIELLTLSDYQMCNINEFRCKNGHCIQQGSQCNAVRDCFDNSDEINCGLYMIL
jgi:hypothetical protein